MNYYMEKSKIIKIFEKVQKIPYEVCKYEEGDIGKSINCGDCRHKSELLMRLLKKEGFEVKKQDVLFDWADLPLPLETIGILKESDTVWKHVALKVKIGDKWIKVDPTWHPSLKKKGFPITENWDGKSDTKLVTDGKVEFFEKRGCEVKPKLNKEEIHKFATALNQFVSA
jgi:hypothetical protein